MPHDPAHGDRAATLQTMNAATAVPVEVRAGEPDSWPIAVALAVVGPLAVVAAIAAMLAAVT